MPKKKPNIGEEVVREAQGDKLPEEVVEVELPDSEHERIHDSMEVHEEEAVEAEPTKEETLDALLIDPVIITEDLSEEPLESEPKPPANIAELLESKGEPFPEITASDSTEEPLESKPKKSKKMAKKKTKAKKTQTVDEAIEKMKAIIETTDGPELEKAIKKVWETTIEIPETRPKKKPKKKRPETPIEGTGIEEGADIITRMKEQDAILKKIAEFPTEITGEVSTEQEIPIAEEAKHYLHLLEYTGQETDPVTNKPLSEYRLIISPFDEHITARWIKQRDVVTRHGFDVAPCDYWDTIYKTSIYYDPVGKEIAVYQLIYNSAMSEIGMFAPKVERELEDKEIVVLLDKHIVAEHLRLSAENLTLRKRVKWWEAYTKALIEAKDDTGGKLYAHMMKMASQLSETDRWKVGKDISWTDKISNWLVKHPDARMVALVGGLIVMVIWALFAVGILKLR